MSSIRVLRIPNVNSRPQEQPDERPGRPPISLLSFLQAENRRLQNMVTQLQQDTKALREALESN
jgi:hypothetical protein